MIRVNYSSNGVGFKLNSQKFSTNYYSNIIVCMAVPSQLKTKKTSDALILGTPTESGGTITQRL